MPVLYLTIILFPFARYPYFYNLEFAAGFSLIKIVGILCVATAAVYLPFSHDVMARFKNRYVLLSFAFFACAMSLSYVRADGYNDSSMLSMFSIVGFLLAYTILADSEEKARRCRIAYIVSLILSCYRGVRELMLYGALNPDFRVSGLIGDPNYFALTLIPGLAMLFPGGHEKDRGGGVWRIAAAAGAVLLFLFFVFMLIRTGSRGGAIAFVAVAALMIAWSRRKGAVLLVLLLLAPLLWTQVDRYVLPRFGLSESETGRYEAGAEISTRQRLKLIRGGLEVIRENWVFGIGAGNFKEKVALYAPELEGHAQIAHNTFIEVFAEHGLLGFLILSGIILFLLKDIVRLFSGRGELAATPGGFPRTVKPIVAGFGVVICSMFLSVQYDRIFWFCVAMLSSLRSFRMDIPIEKRNDVQG